MNTVLPLILLIGLGFLARWKGILRAGDERILSAYVYYFALPALFIVDISRTVFDEKTLRFILVGVAPILAIILIFFLVKLVLRLKTETFYLLVVSTVFGSTAFFGVPFIIFAFWTESAEKLAVLSAAFMSLAGVIASLFFLEMYRQGKECRASAGKCMMTVIGRLSRNPLIIAVAAGLALSLLGWHLPLVLLRPLQMLGRTTATVAIFMLGAFLYGRKYHNLGQALGLSMLRIAVLPLLALYLLKYFVLPGEQSSIVVLMHSMPLAISMMVLSERYDFYKETIASVILISSLAAVVHLNLWLAAVRAWF